MEVNVIASYREIMRLHSQGISFRGIAASLYCSSNTVSKVINQAKKFDLRWHMPESMDNEKICKLLFPAEELSTSYQIHDYDYIHKELAKSGVTFSLLWHEYSESCRIGNTIPYKYSQFCYLYHNYARKTKATMRIKHKPGEKLEVDWAGQTAFIKDNITGESIKAYVFVATLLYSGYSYVEAFLSLNMESWIQAHINCFTFLNGTTRILVPDNLKTGVDQVKKHDSIINKTYNDLAGYYDTAVIPARVRHPKDKAGAECSVGIISTWIIAALRKQTFFSIQELNQATLFNISRFFHRR